MARPRSAMAPGDVLLFRMAPDACVKHAAILSAHGPSDPEPRMIHAYWGRAAVESWMGRWWAGAARLRLLLPQRGRLTWPRCS
ncbi:MAG: hypothetical protein WDM92_07355 [Caulobacteraceae bacterium]